MSIKRTSDVWEYSRTKNTSLLALLAIADHASDDGFAWPGQIRIAHKARCTVRHVGRAITDSESMGELFIHRKPGKSNKYVVLIGQSTEAIYAVITNRLKYTESQITAWLNQRIDARQIVGSDILSPLTSITWGHDIFNVTPPTSATHESSINQQENIIILTKEQETWESIIEHHLKTRFDNNPHLFQNIVQTAKAEKSVDGILFVKASTERNREWLEDRLEKMINRIIQGVDPTFQKIVFTY